MDIVREFLSVYRLYEHPGGEILLGKSGDAKFDLTAMVYKGRSLPGTVKNIRAEGILDCLTGVTDALEEMRRAMLNQASQASRLTETSATPILWAR